jgi:hypothetical protein
VSADSVVGVASACVVAVVVGVLPRNATFKILKHELVKQLKDKEVPA